MAQMGPTIVGVRGIMPVAAILPVPDIVAGETARYRRDEPVWRCADYCRYLLYLMPVYWPDIKGDHSKQDQILFVKIAKYIGFRVYRRSYLICSPVTAYAGNTERTALLLYAVESACFGSVTGCSQLGVVPAEYRNDMLTYRKNRYTTYPISNTA